MTSPKFWPRDRIDQIMIPKHAPTFPDPASRVLAWQMLRSFGYWLVLLLLLFLTLVSVGDYLQYREDPTTYHQVYRKPERQQLISHISGLLAAIALVFHLRGWKGRRFSWITLAYFVSEIGFGVVSNIYDLNPICCT